MARHLEGEAQDEHLALHALILEHLKDEGIPPWLLTELDTALQCAAASRRRGGAAPAESRLLSALGSPGGTGEEARPQAEHAPALGTDDGRTLHGPAPAPVPGRPVPVRRVGRGARSAGPCGGALAVILAVLPGLTFLPCVTYSQWYIDELFAAVRNADARGETPLRQLLRHDFWGNPLWDGGWTHKSYRPLVVLSYALQYRFNGGLIKPQPLRAFNVALHLANCALTHRLVLRSGARWHWACLAAGLFAVHPVHAENVVYLVGRADALATLCWLLAVLAWPAPRARHRGAWRSGALRLLLATSLAVVGGLCKESGFCVLLQLAVGELLGPNPLRGGPLLVVFGAVFLGRSWLTDGTKAGFSFVDTPVQYHSDAGVRLCTYLFFHAKYAQLMAFPWTLSWDYSHDALPLLHGTWRDARILAVLTAYLAMVATASWGAARRNRGVLVGLGNIVVPFVPASNIFFLVGVTVGERLLYPCNVGAAMVLAAIGSHSAERSKQQAGMPQGEKRRGGRSRLFVSGLALLCTFVYLCGLRVYQWSDRTTLFGADAAHYPRSTKARHQFGTVLHRLSRFDEALAHFNASLDLYKDSALTEYCIAQILIETGRGREALRHFETIFSGHALGFGRFNIYALYIDYGFTLMILQRYEEAVPQLLHGLSLNEDVPHGLNALGYSLSQLGRAQEARSAFERGLHYEPTNPFLLNNLGVNLLLTGEVQAGLELVARALEADPGVPAFVHNARIVKALAETGRWPTEQLALELFFTRGN